MTSAFTSSNRGPLAREDKMPLELSKPTEHGEHQAAVRGGSVGPGIAQRAEACTTITDRWGNRPAACG